MKKQWVDPAKRPPQASTLKITGDFDKFTSVMQKIVNKREKPTDASPGPVAS